MKRKLSDEEISEMMEKLLSSIVIVYSKEEAQQEILRWAKRGIMQINGVNIEEKENKLYVAYKRTRLFVLSIEEKQIEILD